MVQVGPVTDAGFPSGIEAIADLAPVDDEAGSGWLVLDAGGVISRWDLAAGTCTTLAATSVPPEPGHQAWCGHDLRRRLHVSASGLFAAVVNDYGRLGEVIDLRAGRVTMALDNDGGHQETVPFSLAFARHHDQDVVIHRTAWNRLDVSEAASGHLLTARGPTSYRPGEPRPDHYLDYFHGALYLSPDGARIFDDGWFWQPVGIPVVWELAAWLDANVWESEDGPTRIDFGWLEDWNRAFTWIGSHRVAIEDTGDDETPACTRVFDLAQAASPGPVPIRQATEVTVMCGPEGRFFSDGTTLLSSAEDGLSLWDPLAGTRTGFTPGFTPAYYHPATRELVEVSGGRLRHAQLGQG
jgi:hypothetical protein